MTPFVNLACPDCGPVHIAPTRWTDGVPVEGDCPLCRRGLVWSPSQVSVVRVGRDEVVEFAVTPRVAAP